MIGADVDRPRKYITEQRKERLPTQRLQVSSTEPLNSIAGWCSLNPPLSTVFTCSLGCP